MSTQPLPDSPRPEFFVSIPAIPKVVPPAKGMGDALARRSFYRASDEFNWGKLATRVAAGSVSLHRESWTDFEPTRNAIAKSVLLTSGRHLQHGDENQHTRNLELHSNCSTSATSFLLFLLLLNGSGVGRDYSEPMMVVDWDNAPRVFNICRGDHPDFDPQLYVTPEAHEESFLHGELYPLEKITHFAVPDSREGWARAAELYEVMAFEGRKDELLVLDWSFVREKGKLIGGMQDRPASGPNPTALAFQKIADQVVGRGLPRWQQTMMVDHFLAECVLVGGARRSARMATMNWADPNAKAFATFKQDYKDEWGYPIFYSSNNSLITTKDFYEQRDVPGSQAAEVFEAATKAAYFGGTGEPGFINVDNFAPDEIDAALYEDGRFADSAKFSISEAAVALMKRLVQGFKTMPYKRITNPCVTSDTWIQTEDGPRRVAELIDKPFQALVGDRSYPASGFFQTGVKPVFKVKTARGFELRLTDNHRVLVERSRKPKFGGSGNGCNIVTEWVEVKDLKIDDKLVLDNHRGTSWAGRGSFEEGWLIGQMVGDGGYNPDKYAGYVRFWGEDRELMLKVATTYGETAGLQTRSDCVGSRNKQNATTQFCARALDVLAEGLIEPGSKALLPELEKSSSDFYTGFLRGFFDADGTVLLNSEKGRSIRLAQSDLEKLRVVQRMLARLGIISTLHENRKEAGLALLPDGKGNSREYKTKANHELIISRDNMLVFADLVGFNEPAKRERLAECVGSLGIKKKPYAETFTASVESIEPDGVEAVYDCKVEEIHAFDANGVVAHNCGEISLVLLGAYCTIADVAMALADTLEEVLEAFRLAVRLLIRCNLMDCLYSREVGRTNRIGVGPTGIFSFAIKFFGISFFDMLDEFGKGKDFWQFMSACARAVKDEARAYVDELRAKGLTDLAYPVTDTTVKPAGCATLDTTIRTEAGVKSLEEVFALAGYTPVDLRAVDAGTWLEMPATLRVFDENNDLKEITKLFVNGVSVVYEIELEDGFTVKLTGNHKLKTLTGWKRVDELTEDDEIVQLVS